MPRRSDAAERLLAYFAAQQLPDQAQLPPERELAESLGLSRGQLRTGLSKLKARGKAWGRVGKGTFVGREPEEAPRALLDLSTLSNPRNIMEARLAIEPMLASLAALRGTPNDFARMEKSVRQSRVARDRASFQRWDEVFHSAVAEAAHNPLMLAIFNAVNESRKREVWGSLRERTLTSSRRTTYIEQHAACLAAMRDRDPTRAATIMRQHLEFISTICDVFGTTAGEQLPAAGAMMKGGAAARFALAEGGSTAARSSRVA
jgi:DNA-binding FadR family transcriptional regulator